MPLSASRLNPALQADRKLSDVSLLIIDKMADIGICPDSDDWTNDNPIRGRCSYPPTRRMEAQFAFSADYGNIEGCVRHIAAWGTGRIGDCEVVAQEGHRAPFKHDRLLNSVELLHDLAHWEDCGLRTPVSESQ